jgi:hypothetical protein
VANNPGGSDEDSEDDGYKKSPAETAAGLYRKLMSGKFIVGLTTLHNYLGKLQYTSLIKNFRPKKLIGRTFNTS